MDVTDWDGVQGLPSGSEQPFYRALPDMGDCVELLGGPRGVRCVAQRAPPLAWHTPSARCTPVHRFRYVAQENLVAIETKAERKISHDLLPHVFEDFDAERAAYRPVQQLRVWYPADDLAPPEAQPQSCSSSGSTAWCVRWPRSARCCEPTPSTMRPVGASGTCKPDASTPSTMGAACEAAREGGRAHTRAGGGAPRSNPDTAIIHPVTFCCDFVSGNRNCVRSPSAGRQVRLRRPT